MNTNIYSKSIIPNLKKENLPKISVMIKNTKKDTKYAISLFNNIEFGNHPELLKQLKEQENERKQFKKEFKLQQKISLQKKTVKPLNTFYPSNKQFNKSRKSRLLNFKSIDYEQNTTNKMEETFNKPTLMPSGDETESIVNNNHNKTYKTRTEVTFPNIKSNTIYCSNEFNLSKQLIWSKCDEINSNCSSFEQGVKRKVSKVLKSKIKLVQKKYGILRTEVDELNPKKGRKNDVKVLSELKVNNKRVLRQTDCVKKISNEFALEANSVLQQIFLTKQTSLTEKENIPNYKKNSLKKIKEMQDISNQSRAAAKRIDKFCIKYDIGNLYSCKIKSI